MEDISHSHLFYFHAFSLLLSLLGFFNSHLHMNTNTFLWISSPLTHTHIAHSFPLPHLFLFSSSATCSLLHLLIHTHAYTHILFLSLSFFLFLIHSFLLSYSLTSTRVRSFWALPVFSCRRGVPPTHTDGHVGWCDWCGDVMNDMMRLMWWWMAWLMNDEWWDEIDDVWWCVVMWSDWCDNVMMKIHMRRMKTSMNERMRDKYAHREIESKRKRKKEKEWEHDEEWLFLFFESTSIKRGKKSAKQRNEI